MKVVPSDIFTSEDIKKVMSSQVKDITFYLGVRDTFSRYGTDLGQE